MPASDVAELLGKAGQNAAGLEHSNQQLGDQASVFDVWTHSYDGMSARLRDFADDPAGSLQRYDSDLDAAVEAGITGEWHSSSMDAVSASMSAQLDGLGGMVDAIGKAKGPLATIGATFALLTGVEQMLSTLVSIIPFPSLPALRVMDMDVGLPHAHNHPPNLVPPAPPVPLPSTGPIIPIPIMSGATRTLINSMPAARCGDMGLGIWCGGFFPMYEVFLGSSSVWIEGARAGRLAVDITKHCMFSSPKPSDPPMGPMVGVTTSASANVLIGGVPMPSLLSLAMAAAIKGLMKGLGKVGRALERSTRSLRQRLTRNMKPGFLRCTLLRAEPVDVVTGEVVVDQQDFSVPGRIRIDWNRHYGSASNRRGLCGYGWETPADARLVLEDDGALVFHDGTGAPTCFASLPARREVEELVDGALCGWVGDTLVVRSKNGLEHHFPVTLEGWPEIPVSRVQDQHGNWLAFVRDEMGLRRIEESAGRVVDVLSANGLIQRMEIRGAGSAPRTLMDYRYDEADDLVGVYDAMGNPYHFQYAGHRLTRHTDRNGLSFHYEYQASAGSHRCVHAWGDGGLYDYRFEFLDAERTTLMTDSLGGSWQVRCDGRHQIVEEVDPCGGVTTYQYDDAGRTTAKVAPSGVRTEWEYDDHGNLLSQVLPDGSATTHEYDEANRLTATVRPNGARWEFAYDGRRLVQRWTPRGGVWAYEYTEEGDLQAEVDPLGNRTTFHPDSFANLGMIVEPSGETRRFEFDLLGRRLASTGPSGDTTRYEYDALGRIVAIRTPSGAAIRMAYDDEGNLVEFLDPIGRRTSLRYAGLGRLVGRVDADGTSIAFHHDTEERLVAVTNQRGQRYLFERDEVGRVVREVDYWGNATTFRLDGDGNALEIVDALGRSTRMAYDAAGRILERSFDDGSVERFEYDAEGNLVGAENDACTVRREFDEEGNLVLEAQGDFSVRNVYDLLGRRIQRESSLGNTLDIAYDALDRALRLTLNERPVWRATYLPRGLVAEAALGAHLRQTFEYDADGKLLRQEIAESAVITSRRYAYDAAGNLVGRADARTGTSVLAVDPVDRVVRQEGPGDREIALSYDPAGDILRAGSETPTGGSRVARHGDTRYEIDAAGNAIRRVDPRGTTRLSWDGANRLAGSENADDVVSTYGYDALGRRVFKRVGNQLTRFYWDGEVLLAEDPASRGSAREYVFREGTFEPVASVADQTLFFDTDHVGLPHNVLDRHGGRVWSGVYGPGGNLIEMSGNPVDCLLRFQGQYHDEELDLDYNLQRYFDPSAGTFLSMDPIGLAAGVNPYEGPRSVWRWCDPLGLGCRIRGPDGEWVRLSDTTLDEAQSMYRSLQQGGMSADEAKRLIIDLDRAAAEAPILPNPNQSGVTRAAPGYRPTGRAPRGEGLDPNSLWKRRRGR